MVPQMFVLSATLLAVCLAAQCAQALELFGPQVSAMNVSRNPGYSGQVGSLEEPFLEAMKRTIRGDPTKKHADSLLAEQESYDFNAHLTTTDLLYRAGFYYELHNSTSLDGYMTQLVRVINPKAKRSSMKLPPVVLYAGQGASPAAFLMSAIGRSHPLAWPRDEEWPAAGLAGNRSLALTLANNGYDVWLVPARGVDAANRVCKQPAENQTNQVDQMKQIFGDLLAPGQGHQANSALKFKAEGLKSFVKNLDARDYWSFSDDEIIQFELGLQLGLVLNATGCAKLSLVSYSNGGFISFGFMALKPEFAHRHLDTIVSIAPAVFVDKSNLVLGAGGLLSALSLPGSPWPSDGLDRVARQGLAHLCRPKTLRYSVCKMLLNQLYGHSDMFSTHLELSIIDYVGRPLSSRSLRQTLQAGFSGQLRQYDFGPLGNLIEYDQARAPSYELANVKHPRLFIISGGKDSIVSDKSITKLIGELQYEPQRWTNIPGYNHLDLLAGHDNSERVNLPVLHILDDRNLEANYYREDAFNSGGAEVATFGQDRARAAGRLPLRVGNLPGGQTLEAGGSFEPTATSEKRDKLARLPTESNATRVQIPLVDLRSA